MSIYCSTAPSVAPKLVFSPSANYPQAANFSSKQSSCRIALTRPPILIGVDQAIAFELAVLNQVK
jgi:hypothetical protein